MNSQRPDHAQYRHRYQALFTTIPAMVHSIDAAGRIIEVSDFWLSTLGYTRDEVLGRPSVDFLTEPSRVYAREVVLPEFFRTGFCRDVPYQMKTGDGRVLDVLLSATSERDGEGKVVRSLAVLTDVTRQKRDAELLAEHRERLELVLRGGNLGFWDWDVASGKVVFNERWAEILGFTLNELKQSYETWVSRLHVEDRDHTLSSLRAALNDRREYFEAEHRMRTRKGDYRWVHGVGRVTERGEDGAPLRMTGIMIDVHERKLSAMRLAASERRFRDVALASGDWLWEIDENARYTYASGRVRDILGLEPESLIGKTPFDIMPPDEAERVTALFEAIRAELAPIVDVENRFVTADGREGVFLTNGVPVFDESGDYAGYFGVDKDITARKANEARLRLYKQVVDSALEGITITDPEGTIVEVNPAFTTITGYTREEALGENPRILKSKRHTDAFYEEMWQTLKDTGNWEGEIYNRRKNGETYPEWLSISSIRNESGETTHYAAVFHDISQLKKSEETILHQAYYDSLTGLPNRILLRDRLSMAISRARRSDHGLALICMDLDDFKAVNDALGHDVGDELLVAVAGRVERLLSGEQTVARLGGDEFMFLVEGERGASKAVRLARRLIDALASPLYAGGRELFVTPSLGISLFPEDGEDPETLIKNADAAMYQAKLEGRNRYRLFTAAMTDRVRRRIEMEGALRRALDEGEITAFFQPKVEAASGRVTGMEALARWVRADGGVVGPDRFIPLAEEVGLIEPLSRTVMAKAFAFAARLGKMGYANLSVAVNLSQSQFMDEGLKQSVQEALAACGLPGHRVELEITESFLAHDLEAAKARLGELASLGAALALDDFGTGYSSLAHLRALRLDVLKIDKSFVVDLPDDPLAVGIARAILDLGRSLGLTIVAEGVETAEQLDFLTSQGCRIIQGYYYSPPLCEDDFIDYLGDTPGP